MKKITIILPVYNVEEYITDCITSIINQTSKNFDLLIINDGTKDKSIEIAKNLLEVTDVEFRIIDRENGGLSAARNTGINNATGEYLAFVDSDDVITPDYVETMVKDINKFKTDLCIENFKWVSDENKFEFEKENEGGDLVDKTDFLKKILKRKIFPYFGTFCIKREYIKNNNLMFDESVWFSVDQAYMWRLMVNVDKYSYNTHKIYNYYERPNSIMTASKVEKMLTGFPSIKKCAEDLSENPYFKSELILTRWKISVLHTIALHFTWESFEKVYNEIKPKFADTIKYPDIKVKMVALIMIFGKRMLYQGLRRF